MGSAGTEMRDRQGRTIAPGVRVRCNGEEGVVRRVEPRYGVLTIVVEERTGKSERMVRAAAVEVVGEPPGEGAGDDGSGGA